MDDLFEYYARCAYAKSARKHIATAGAPSYVRDWCEPVDAYWENLARLFTSHQCDYLELRDDIEGTLLY